MEGYTNRMRLYSLVKEAYWLLLGEGQIEENVFVTLTLESLPPPAEFFRPYLHCYTTLYDGRDAGLYTWAILYDPVGVIVWFKEPGSSFDMFFAKNWMMAC